MSKFTFRLYDLSLKAVKLVAPLLLRIARHDAELGRQGKDALCSMHLNIAESIDALGGNRPKHQRFALGSTNEVIAALDIGVALGYIESDPIAEDALQHVRATLLRCVMTRR